MWLLARLKKIGPGLLITAAFIGPGTVATASTAGAQFGFALVWSLLFAVLATIALQEMAARLGLAARMGLGEAVRSIFRNTLARVIVCGMVIAAIGLGNAAYQTGNITGAAIGLSVLTGVPNQVWSLVIGLAAFGLLAGGAYKWIERALICLVVLMSLVFIITAIMVRPDMLEFAKGTFIPTLPSEPSGALLTVVGLIGTTVVPYNLFLHASSVQKKWPESAPTGEALLESRIDLSLAISLGGLITVSIVATAAAAFFGKRAFDDPADMALQLEPLLGGPAAMVCFAVGLLSAGMTSAITAPLAAAFAVCGALGWPPDLKSWRFRGVWFVVLAAGTVIASLGFKSPAETILIAQVANGLLLPLIAVVLLVAVNRRDLMGQYKNGVFANIIGAAVVAVAAGLGILSVLKQFGVIGG